MKRIISIFILLIILIFSVVPSFAGERFEDYIISTPDESLRDTSVLLYDYIRYLDKYDKNGSFCSKNPYEKVPGSYCELLDLYRNSYKYDYYTISSFCEASGVCHFNLYSSEKKIKKDFFGFADTLEFSEPSAYNNIHFSYYFDDGVLFLSDFPTYSSFKSSDYSDYITFNFNVVWSNYHVYDYNGDLYHKSDVYVLIDDLESFFNLLLSLFKLELIIDIILLGLSSFFIMYLLDYFAIKLFRYFKNVLLNKDINL